MNHPHNANAKTYEEAVNAVVAADCASYGLVEEATRLCFETIEGTDARRDAVAAYKAATALRDAANIAHHAFRLARGNAAARAEALARSESNNA